MARDRESIRAYLALVQDAALEGRVDMAAHDKARHGGRYDEATMTCKLRDRLAAGDRSDDSIRVDGAGKQKAGVGADDPDRAYLEVAGRIAEAQRAGRQPDPADVSAASGMVREAAAKAMPDTKVVDEDGLPKVVYHSGTFGTEETVADIGREGMHFGTKKAASDRKETKLASEMKARQQVGTFRASDGRWYYITDQFGPNEYDSFKNGAEGWSSESEARRAGEESFEMEAANSTQEDYGYRTTACYLNVLKPQRNRDEGTYWGGAVRRAKEIGYDGIEYENMFEDRGSKSYVVFSPNQIKSADPVTYDDAGNVIPLSRRFDITNPDIRY